MESKNLYPNYVFALTEAETSMLLKNAIDQKTRLCQELSEKISSCCKNIYDGMNKEDCVDEIYTQVEVTLSEMFSSSIYNDFLFYVRTETEISFIDYFIETYKNLLMINGVKEYDNITDLSSPAFRHMCVIEALKELRLEYKKRFK